MEREKRLGGPTKKRKRRGWERRGERERENSLGSWWDWYREKREEKESEGLGVDGRERK